MNNFVIQISPIYATLIVLALALVGMLIGIWAGWILTERDLNRARQANAALREAHDRVLQALTAALHTRDVAQRELQDQLQALDQLHTQHRANQHQLEKAHATLRTLEQRVDEIGLTLRSTRIQNDGLRAELFKSGRVSSEKQKIS
jgi:Na+/glutamate symporter